MENSFQTQSEEMNIVRTVVISDAHLYPGKFVNVCFVPLSCAVQRKPVRGDGWRLQILAKRTKSS